jgi:hypothetical protein
MPNGIRRYGPGKFNTILDSYVYDLSLDGADTLGDVSEIGIVYSAVDLGPDALADIEKSVAKGNDGPLTPEERRLIEKSAGAILTENDQGFVSVDYFDTEDELDKDWEEIESEVDDMYEGDVDGEESEEEEAETAEEESA